MMDHDELPKGKVPDLLQDEEIPARYTLKGPPTGQVLGSFSSFQLGLLWKIPNAEGSEMLKSIAPDKYIEEKIFFEQDFKKNEKVGLSMKIALYKVSNSPDLHLRAVYSDEPEKDAGVSGEGIGLNFLRSEHQVFGAAVVDETGKPLLDEKFSRSYMFGGQRYWEIPSIISAKEFGKTDLATADGSLLLRITFGNKEDLPPQHFLATQQAATVEIKTSATATTDTKDTTDTNASNANETSPSNENLKPASKKSSKEAILDEDSNLKTASSHTLLDVDVSTIGLDPLPYQLTKFFKAGKLTDGTVHVVDQYNGEKADFPIHRVVLAAQSPFFEAGFAKNTNVKIDHSTIPCVKEALDYMYSNQVKSTDFNELVHLIHLAEEFKIRGLKSKALNQFVHCPMKIPEAMAIFRLGVKYNSAVLRVHAHDYLIKLKGKIGEHTDKFKEFMNETKTDVLFGWLIRE